MNCKKEVDGDNLYFGQFSNQLKAITQIVILTKINKNVECLPKKAIRLYQ
ncbi:MAG: hypothetical protein IM333_18225 [Microcystis sp. M048S1]|nr:MULTISPECIES: hypothetical protein [unclassified Microcystis]MCA2900316.1 hypothetical protein [Microcystis sp. M035S1]MCA2721647.1 hypothetical protein [Microcystis sp. M176S2]MCA2776479.1 hypothetical protein [Microcystis sp. M135S2]MCA2777969.1 hypothetical protein [Microcystis sp. M136S2]MCA2802419.1 hypothetical protein [Microcystis sp. M113S2]